MALAYLVPLLLFAAPIAPDRTPEEILSEIRSRKNEVPSKVFDELAKQKTPEAFEALVEGLEVVTKAAKARIAYLSFQHFRGVPGVEGDAVEYLAGCARKLRDQRGVHAAIGLGGLLPAAGGELADLVLDPPTEDIGTAALLRLVEEGMPLEDAALDRLARSKELAVRYEGLLEATRRIEDEAGRARRIAKLARSKAEVDRLVATELLATIEVPGRFEMLGEGLGDRYAPIARKAVDSLVSAHDPRAVGVLVERLGVAERGEGYRIARALERLTGLSLGTQAETWTRWYEKEGETFELPESTGEAAPNSPGGGAATTVFYGLPIHADRVVFAIDTSDSMKAVDERKDGARRIDVAKGELTRAIESFDESRAFDIVHFGADAASWQGELVPARRRSKREALEHVEDLRLTWGTEIHGGLRQAFRDPAADAILFLTDGDPQLSVLMDRGTIRRMLAQWNRTRHTAIDCLSIGTERQWLRHLARESGGRYRRIQ